MRIDRLFAKEIIVADFEWNTTKMSSYTQISGHKVSNNEIIESFNAYVKLPKGQKLEEEAKKITGITDELLEEKGLEPNIAISSFLEFVGENDIVVWGNCDVKTFTKNVRDNEMPELLKHSQKFVNLQNQMKIFSEKSLDWISLKKAVEMFDLNFEGSHHNSMDDAFNAFQLLKYFRENREYFKKQVFALWVKKLYDEAIFMEKNLNIDVSAKSFKFFHSIADRNGLSLEESETIYEDLTSKISIYRLDTAEKINDMLQASKNKYIATGDIFVMYAPRNIAKKHKSFCSETIASTYSRNLKTISDMIASYHISLKQKEKVSSC